MRNNTLLATHTGGGKQQKREKARDTLTHTSCLRLSRLPQQSHPSLPSLPSTTLAELKRHGALEEESSSEHTDGDVLLYVELSIVCLASSSCGANLGMSILLPFSSLPSTITLNFHVTPVIEQITLYPTNGGFIVGRRHRQMCLLVANTLLAPSPSIFNPL
jgi:hypothetical protein